MRVRDVVFVLFLLGTVLLFWPVILVVMFVWHKQFNKRNIVRVGSGLSHLSFSCAETFDPAWWLCFPAISGHLQTLAVLLKTRGPEQRWHDMRTVLDTGGAQVGLWWKQGGGKNKDDASRAVVVIFPGLTGDAKSTYAVQMCRRLARTFRVVLACPRGCGDSTLGNRPYNARDARDHLAVLQHVHAKYPEAKVFAVGFSLGANLLVNCLADYSAELSFLSGAAALGSPWDLIRSSRVLETGISRLLFSASLADGLLDFYRRNEKEMQSFEFPKPLKAAKVGSVRLFDSAVTAPAAKYGEGCEKKGLFKW